MTRALGIDLGDARIGVAISDELGMLAHPLETITVKQIPPIERIRTLVAERHIGTVIVGLPRNMDGSHGPAAEKALTFMAALRDVLPCPVIAWDERLSTISAQRAMRAAGRKAKDQRAVIDQAAAQIILQNWLDSQDAVSL
jgi:putative Holliday junction resolvase